LKFNLLKTPLVTFVMYIILVELTTKQIIYYGNCKKNKDHVRIANKFYAVCKK